VFKLSEEPIEELRFSVIKKMLADLPELRERVKEYLLNDKENKE
jgi:hypothetical protein